MEGWRWACGSSGILQQVRKIEIKIELVENKRKIKKGGKKIERKKIKKIKKKIKKKNTSLSSLVTGKPTREYINPISIDRRDY